ncbi:hypothetical protein PspLS_11499 [Pyricularia sp. CBS 133598]|nr:hypothetical protein PspLS_11499 [Pyricularia sp. CBS 133598]
MNERVECLQHLSHHGQDMTATRRVWVDKPAEQCDSSKALQGYGSYFEAAAKSGPGITPLMFAAAAGDERSCGNLLAYSAAGAALEQNGQGISAISIFVAHVHDQSFKQLVFTVQGQFDFPDICGRSLLWWTRRNSSQAIAEVIQQEAAKRDVALHTPTAHPSTVD